MCHRLGTVDGAITLYTERARLKRSPIYIIRQIFYRLIARQIVSSIVNASTHLSRISAIVRSHRPSVFTALQLTSFYKAVFERRLTLSLLYQLFSHSEGKTCLMSLWCWWRDLNSHVGTFTQHFCYSECSVLDELYYIVQLTHKLYYNFYLLELNPIKLKLV